MLRYASQRRAQGRRPWRELIRDLRRRFAEHELPIYASAIAFRGLIAVIPLALLGLGPLSALGLQDTWHNCASSTACTTSRRNDRPCVGPRSRWDLPSASARA
jgi:uncharacterized BrkB/YihY/UPF0761 family membrane protein